MYSMIYIMVNCDLWGLCIQWFTMTLAEIHLVDRGWNGQDSPFVRLYDMSTTPELREAILLKF